MAARLASMRFSRMSLALRTSSSVRVMACSRQVGWGRRYAHGQTQKQAIIHPISRTGWKQKVRPHIPDLPAGPHSCTLPATPAT